MKKFRDISEKNADNKKILKFFIKGIIFPVCSIIKNTFCDACEYNGKQILKIYDILMKLLYLKILI